MIENSFRKTATSIGDCGVAAVNSSSEIQVWTLTEFMMEAFSESEPIVEGLIHRGELQLLSATAKTGKSQLCANLAIQVAKGGEYFLEHFPVTQTRVLLIQTEISKFFFQQRMFTMMEKYKKGTLMSDFIICNHRLKIDEVEGRKSLQRLIQQVQPGLLILDPFYTLHSRDEDKAKEIGPVLTWLKSLVLEYNFGCVLVHHQGKRSEMDTRQVGHRHRGSSAIADVPDGSISLQKTSTKNQATISFESRNHISPSPLTLSLNESLWWVSLGEASDEGKPLYSLEDVLSVNEHILRAALIERFCNRYKRKTRTAETFISAMMNAKRLVKTSDDDGTIWLSRSDSNFPAASPQPLIEIAGLRTPKEEDSHG